ncbi:uncharacterized protein [Rutidosis leptorrhynchoides]|uniref:uncharacterized protein n=1 Tax=Rutidosis leptorrhynchoides TaxID=125765 RepID=UPI003A996E12
MPDGKKRVVFSVDEVQRGCSQFTLQLYGYFIGTSIDYRVVNMHLRRMWGIFDFKEVTKTAAGFYLCKFKSEKGMKEVLENGPWLINNVPFIINQWFPGVWLQKIEPRKVPLWVCVHNLPVELWNGKSIGKLVSSIGKPILMDKVTLERCKSKNGRFGFARVLVEVDASDELPNSLEFSFPAIGPYPARVGCLEVTYQWKPHVYTHCKLFGHSFKLCKIRPKTDDEKAAAAIKNALNIDNSRNKIHNGNSVDVDGFQTLTPFKR